MKNYLSKKSSQNACVPRRRRGAISVVAAGGLILMLGFCAIAADYGLAVVTKNKLQRTCDAAALAGVRELRKSAIVATDQANATQKALVVAQQNGVTLTASDVSFPSNGQIRVTALKPQRFLFGAAIGIPDGKVNASALAGQTYLAGMQGAVPLGITYQTWLLKHPTAENPNPGIVNLRLTRNTQEKFGPLNAEASLINGSTPFDVAALDMRYGNSGNSGALFQEELSNGSNSMTYINQQIDPLGSSINSQGQKIDRAISDRIARAAGAPWYDNGDERKYTFPNYPSDNPRVIYILVGADGYAANNSNPKLNLAYYAPAYIAGPVYNTGGNGNNQQTFLPVRLLPAGQLSSNVPNPGFSETDTGISVSRLIG